MEYHVQSGGDRASLRFDAIMTELRLLALEKSHKYPCLAGKITGNQETSPDDLQYLNNADEFWFFPKGI